MMTTSLEKDIDTLPDHDILDMEKEMRDILEKAHSYNADKYTCTAVFVSGQMDVQVLENLIGEVHSVFVDEKNDIDRYSTNIRSLKPISNTHAWIRSKNNKYPALIDRTGNEMDNIKSPCSDIMISNSGDIFLPYYEMCFIDVLNHEQDNIGTIDTKPLQPTYISKTENDDILVTLMDDGDRYTLVPTSRRIVQRMTLTGEVLHTYEFREDGKTRLFTWPGRTSENKNTDICIVNRLRDDKGELAVLHQDGRVKFTYIGDGLESINFLLYDVECDDKCHILLTEGHSKGIHLLSPEGMYMCTLRQYEQLRPLVISIHGDNLWCGFGEGIVKVFKYLT